ncbi:MAG: ATP synthase subunit I [Alphaproteobacteria bacterium]|nr:ATP synthase subunit I [Alphaproteobacteria bacterium]
MNTTTISLNDFYTFMLIGAALGVVYLFLLWQTTSTLARAKKKNLVLFISAALRIFLLIFVALVFSGQNLSHFLIIMCGFLLTRIVLLKILKPTLKKKITSSEILYADNKKTKQVMLKQQKKKRR